MYPFLPLLFVFFLGLFIYAPEISSFLGSLYKRWKNRNKISMVDSVVEQVCSFLKSPIGWQIDKYQAVHEKLGIVMWVANEDYGMSLKVFGEDVKLTKKNQLKLWNAYQKFLSIKCELAMRKTTEELALKAISYYTSLENMEVNNYARYDPDLRRPRIRANENNLLC